MGNACQNTNNVSEENVRKKIHIIDHHENYTVQDRKDHDENLVVESRVHHSNSYSKFYTNSIEKIEHLPPSDTLRH